VTVTAKKLEEEVVVEDYFGTDDRFSI